MREALRRLVKIVHLNLLGSNKVMGKVKRGAIYSISTSVKTIYIYKEGYGT